MVTSLLALHSDVDVYFSTWTGLLSLLALVVLLGLWSGGHRGGKA